MTVTYIALTPEVLDKTIKEAVKIGVEAYKEEAMKNDIRGVSEWANYLNIDRRTLISKIENKIINPISVNPYRISRYEIDKSKSRSYGLTVPQGISGNGRVYD